MKTTGILACLVMLGCGSSPKQGPTPPVPVSAETSPAAAPTPASAPAQTSTATLFDRLGGLPAVTAVVGDFVANVAADPRINQRFFNTDIENLKKLLVELVCMATSGPCKYSGRDMGIVHAGMDIVDDEFTAIVEDLVKSLDKFKVKDKDKEELLGAIGSLKRSIVVSADKLKPIDVAKLAAVTKVASTIKDKGASELLALAVIAGQRGQRSYAEQLFTRAELVVGPKPLASIASAFRAGAPPRITTTLKKMPADAAAQPKTVGGSETDEPDAKPAAGQLHGSLRIDGKVPNTLGVIQLWPDKGGKKRKAKTRVIEQRDRTFMPHVMAVPVGSTVSFPNFDPIYHNVFSTSKSRQFDLGLYKNGDTREVKVDKAGIVRLGCNIHANMSAYLVVVDAPHYAVVDADGNFSFKSLAPGKYKVQAWVERSGEPTTSEVTIKAGDNESNIEIKDSSATAVGPDKFGTARQ
jgi:hemoglobin